MGVTVTVPQSKLGESVSNLEKEPSPTIISALEPLADDCGNANPIFHEKRRRDIDYQSQKGACTESLGSRRGIVNFLEITQSFVNNDMQTDENQVCSLSRAHSGIDTIGNSIPKRGSEEDLDKVAGTKSINSILLKSIHSSGSMGSREGFQRVPWANMYHGSQDDIGRRVRSSSTDSCAMDRDDMFSRVQMLVSRMRIHRIESETINLCANAGGRD
ncbi:unnamed protein product [Phytomonas sp. EM1]|nr:unnamed protein product [Phytomonas sp. EM1]|eukprot:CCW65530.1 unnamed protein product [Phytomonas sp. isolate EM1]